MTLIEERDLTFEERATFGECSVCKAKQGEWCDGSMGIPLGRNAQGEIPEKGVHIARLQGAPRKRRVYYGD